MAMLGALMVALFATAAYAATIKCTGGPCNGTPQRDTITGSRFSDEISARGGSDEVNARGGLDEVDAGRGNDTVRGQRDTDILDGGVGRDLIEGNRGNDDIIDGPLEEFDRDLIFGGSGIDSVDSRNFPASRDIVNCGPGEDNVSADAADVVRANCEVVF